VAGRRQWSGALDTRGLERTTVWLQTAAVDGARGEAVSDDAWSGCGRLSGWTRTVLTAPLRRGALPGWLGAERWRLTGGPHVSAISELKFTPRRK
jgi:hypothetical protein